MLTPEPVPAKRVVGAALKAEEEQRRRHRRMMREMTTYSRLSPLGQERDARGHVVEPDGEVS